MNVMVVGSGGREHALCWKISKSKRLKKLYCLPGNGGIEKIAECVEIQPEEKEKIINFAVDKKVDLVVIGPEAPLVNGLADNLEEKRIKFFGPNSKGSKLEGSKIYSKEFMVKYNIPTSTHMSFSNSQKAKKELENFKLPYVVKADGLAAGKGVLICKTHEDGIKAIEELMENSKFGSAGKKILIEEFLEGVEASLLCLVSKNKIIPLESARDYKKAYDNDEGLNTGGMGCFSPNPLFNKELKKYIDDNILKKIEKGLKEEEILYTGILFIGLMIKDNKAKVLEFNVRFGDPETQVVIPRLKNDIIEIILKTLEGNIKEEDLLWSDKKAVTVVLASGGYPKKYQKGKTIKGLDKLDDDIIVFHSGTKKDDDKFITNGGRVLALTALGESLEKAREKVYNNIVSVKFDNIQYRKDIAKL